MPFSHCYRPALFAALILVSGETRAAEPCLVHYADGKAPQLANAKLARDSVRLCFGGFAVLHSGVSRTPVYAAQRLTRASIAAARSVDRMDAFHEEDRLPRSQRAALRDYVGSGYDRGHLAPAGDMPTGTAQAESFSLANIVPQNRKANRSIWAAVEESVRRLATWRGDLFVVTGVVFEGDRVEAINRRVLIPTRLFKAVFDPQRGDAAAYVAMNDPSGRWQIMSLAQLEALSGIDAFPGLDHRSRTTAMRLPEPRAFSRDAPRREISPKQAAESWLRNEIHRILRRMWRDFMRSIF